MPTPVPPAPRPAAGAPSAGAGAGAEAGPDSWSGKVVVPVDDVNVSAAVVAPARIISVGPAAPEPPVVNAYAVRDSEQTLLDHAPPFDADETERRSRDFESPRRVVPAREALVAVAVPTDDGEDSAPQSRPLARPIGKRWASQLIDPRLVLLLEPYSQRSASFRTLRDNLLAKNAPRIIAVTSPGEHEGKTTCAINLALALGERPSTRVLLLEGNFFAPELAKIFHVDNSTPFAPEMNLPWLLPYRVAEVAHGFHVAAIVQEPGEPPPVFNGRWYDMVMGHLADADYDHLVIDAPALDGSSPVMQVVGIAEGTLLTIRSGNTTARTLRRAAEQIPRGRALGVTLIET
jgi:Mrp family chromosome partitioning ATPase